MTEFIEQRTPEWFEMRRGRVTGSMIGAILGCNPWMGPGDAMRTMVRSYHRAESEFTGNVATEWGNANEAGATLDYEMDTGYKVGKASFVMMEHWLGASPDGYVGENGLVEIKCPYGKREITHEDEFTPLADQPHYYAQVQIQLLVTDRAWCDFYQWAPLAQKCERVAFDLIYASGVIEKLFKFYERFLVELDNPIHLQPIGSALAIEADDEALAMADEYMALRDKAAEIKERMDEILATLADTCGESTFGKYKLKKTERKGSVSYAAVVKEHCKGVDLEPYRGKPSSSWRLS